MKIAFTGHRPDKLGGYDNKTNKRTLFMEALNFALAKRAAFIERKDILIISGMALGTDQWAAEWAIDHFIDWVAYIPFPGQESAWPKESQEYYNNLLSTAKDKKYICGPGYAPWKMQKRNQAMVDDCDLLIAFFDGSSGGTKNCVDYARSVKKEIIIISPLSGEVVEWVNSEKRKEQYESRS